MRDLNRSVLRTAFDWLVVSPAKVARETGYSECQCERAMRGMTRRGLLVGTESSTRITGRGIDALRAATDLEGR